MSQKGKRFDLIVPVGDPYMNAAGQQKRRYIKVGSLWAHDAENIRVKIDSMPVGAWDGWLQVKPPFENKTQPPNRGAGFPPDDDEMPF
jgi:hypothetical protein